MKSTKAKLRRLVSKNYTAVCKVITNQTIAVKSTYSGNSSPGVGCLSPATYNQCVLADRAKACPSVPHWSNPRQRHRYNKMHKTVLKLGCCTKSVINITGT